MMLDVIESDFRNLAVAADGDENVLLAVELLDRKVRLLRNRMNDQLLDFDAGGASAEAGANLFLDVLAVGSGKLSSTLGS